MLNDRFKKKEKLKEANLQIKMPSLHLRIFLKKILVI